MADEPSQPPFPSFMITPDEKKHLPWYDNTKLVALNTCPTWGTIRYLHKKTIGKGASRAMALEAGGAAHEAFALIRFYELLEFGPAFYKKHLNTPLSFEVIDKHGTKVFGSERWAECKTIFQRSDDLRTRCMLGASYVLNTCGFYDDPRDKRRTLTNIEESVLAYIDRVGLGEAIPVVHGAYVGIEIPFDIIGDFRGREIRFVGKFDAETYDANNIEHIQIDENKTTSRIDDSWHTNYTMAHQITGYLVAASVRRNRLVDQANLLGLAIPLPRSADYGGFVRFPVSRTPKQFSDWIDWVRYTVDEGDKWIDDPLAAPKYTHSCNRYFRPCPFVPLCHNNEEEQKLILEEMEVDEWDPLKEPTT